jgi:hypothetical protein
MGSGGRLACGPPTLYVQGQVSVSSPRSYLTLAQSRWPFFLFLEEVMRYVVK